MPVVTSPRLKSKNIQSPITGSRQTCIKTLHFFYYDFPLRKDNEVTFIMEQKILANLVEDAKKVYSDKSIMQKVVVTQGIHESGFLNRSGGSALAIRCNNLFGMKARLDKNGNPIDPAESFPTWEHIEGQDKQVRAWFRKFKDHAECFAAHRKLMERPRYAPVMTAKTLDEAFKQLQKCGYATDPRYPQKLMSVYLSTVSKVMV